VQYREAPANEYVRRLVAAGVSAEYARSQVEILEALAQVNTTGNPATVRSAIKTLAAWTESELMPVIESLDERSQGGAFSRAGFDPWSCGNRGQVCDGSGSSERQLVADVKGIKKVKPMKWSSSAWSISLR
jgi:hypothetical protein